MGNRSGVALVCLALVGCGGGAAKPKPAATPAPKTATPEATATVAAGDDEGQIRAMFADYNRALLDRDFARACTHLSPETTEKLRANLKQANIADVPRECAPLLDALYTEIGRQGGDTFLQELLKTATVDTVEVKGAHATLHWHATVQGENRPTTQTARRIDGEWKLVDVRN